MAAIATGRAVFADRLQHDRLRVRIHQPQLLGYMELLSLVADHDRGGHIRQAHQPERCSGAWCAR